MVVGWQPSQVTTPSGTPDSLTALTTVIVRDTASSRRSNGTGVTSGFCAYAAGARLKSTGSERGTSPRCTKTSADVSDASAAFTDATMPAASPSSTRRENPGADRAYMR